MGHIAPRALHTPAAAAAAAAAHCRHIRKEKKRLISLSSKDLNMSRDMRVRVGSALVGSACT